MIVMKKIYTYATLALLTPVLNQHFGQCLPSF